MELKEKALAMFSAGIPITVISSYLNLSIEKLSDIFYDEMKKTEKIQYITCNIIIENFYSTMIGSFEINTN